MKSNKKNLSKIIFFVLVTGFILVSFGFIPRLLMPMAWTFVLYLIFLPIFRLFLRFGFSNGMSSFFVVMIMVSCTLIPIFQLAPMLSIDSSEIKEKLPVIQANLNKLILYIDSKVSIPGFTNIGQESLEKMITFLKKEAELTIVKIPNLLGMLLEWTFIVPLTLFFMFKDGERLKKYYFRLIPNNIFESFYGIIAKFNRHLGDYIFAKFFEALVVGGLVGVCFLFTEIPYPIFLGFIAGITNIIPYIGPILGAIPGIAVMFVEVGEVNHSVGVVAIIYLLVNLLDMIIIFPVLVSKIVNLHPFVVIISVILGGQLFGVVGMIVSIPLTTALKLLFTEFYRKAYPEALLPGRIISEENS